MNAVIDGADHAPSELHKFLEAKGVLNTDPKAAPHEILHLQSCRAGEVVGARTAQLRDPGFESGLAGFYRDWNLSAMRMLNGVTLAILDHHENGGLILTTDGSVLDLERMETRGEKFVYDTKGGVVFLEKDCRLLSFEASFGEAPRRTINRLFKKADSPSNQCTDVRRMPMLFWLECTRSIIRERCQ